MTFSGHRLVQFQKKVYDYYSLHRRKMPWREILSPYSIFISEVMLQQTQVERVISHGQAQKNKAEDGQENSGQHHFFYHAAHAKEAHHHAPDKREKFFDERGFLPHWRAGRKRIVRILYYDGI